MAMIDHDQLAAEWDDVQNMSYQERTQLKITRQRHQLRVNAEYQRTAPSPPPRNPRLRFSAEIELLDATTRNDIDEVTRLLELGADPNSHDRDGVTPLHQCSIDGNAEMMTLLLSRGANVDARDIERWTPLHCAANCAHIKAVQILIKSGANLLAVDVDGNIPCDVCDDERTRVIIEKIMVERGVTQQSTDDARGAAEKDMLSDMKLMHQEGIPLDSRMHDGSTYLHIAAANGYYDVAVFLLRNRVDPNMADNDLWTPVHAAAARAKPDLLELLCDNGGDISAETGNMRAPIDLCGEDGFTRAVITQLLDAESKKKDPKKKMKAGGGFGVRDSRRQPRKRSKFESPGQAVVAEKMGNPFSSRGTIRRQSLRDKTGLTPARLEAQAEKSALMRFWSREDLSSDQPSSSSSQPVNNVPVRETSPTKSILKGATSKTKPTSSDEGVTTSERGVNEEEESSPTRGPQRSDSKHTLNSSGSPNRRKKAGCCVIC